MKHTAQSIFEAVCDLPKDQRGPRVDELCEGDASLKAEVMSLLDAATEAGEFLLEPTLDSATTPGNEAELTEGPGATIDRYKLLEQIGAGGFGVVYMAQQNEPVRRRVALKIIKLGMDTKQVVARFDAERQALAMMDHPGIAAVLDGGSTETGRPYFVMELVRGDPITTFCDKRNLPLRERLDLFTQVCNAISHAHQKGIIHRDIKPSNVLVTVVDDKPMVKVIDFGIAKATNCELTQKTLFTEFRQLIGTPQYMSPEQAERSGIDVDTRTDIYSLGVLLYEMLTGRTPLDPKKLNSAGWAEMQRMIVEDEPSRPSFMVTSSIGEMTDVARRRAIEPTRLGAMLRGDLDWIVLKTLNKERSRRYSSASELAADVQRFLADEPVEATPPSKRYAVQKLLKRHRRTVAAAAAVFAALLIGLVTTSIAARKAMMQRELAQQRLNEAEMERRRASRTAIAAGASMTMAADDAESLAELWQGDIATRPENERSVERAKYIAWYTGWLLGQGEPAQASEIIEAAYPEIAKTLDVNDPTFFSIINTRIRALSMIGGDATKIADSYAELIRALEAQFGEERAIEFYPEYAGALFASGKEQQAVEMVESFLDHYQDHSGPLSNELNYRLGVSLDSLAVWSDTHPELYRQLKTLRTTGAIDQNDAELARDLKTLQGRWRYRRFERGRVVEQMEQHFDGDNFTTHFIDPAGNLDGGRSGTFELYRSGGVKVLKAKLAGDERATSAFIYHVQGDTLTMVSRMLANEPSLPDIRLMVYRRQTQSE